VACSGAPVCSENQESSQDQVLTTLQDLEQQSSQIAVKKVSKKFGGASTRVKISKTYLEAVTGQRGEGVVTLQLGERFCYRRFQVDSLK